MRQDRPESPLAAERRRLYSRRQVLIAAAGGSAALLFGLPARLFAAPEAQHWQVLEVVQQHLFPSEPDAPGAREILALDYLRGMLRDGLIDADEGDFVLQGVTWLDDLARQQDGAGFVDLEHARQAALLQRIARSRAGENWLATLLTYLFEALLCAPAYAGNPNGIGWRWLHYTPGFPLPDTDTLYWRLPT